jgi:DNA helicase-2/ATP-dependent DNA helicase PcrA
MFRLLRGKDKGNVLPKAAELCDLYSYARNTKTKLSDALVEQLPQAVEYKAQIAELMKAYEQRKQERNFWIMMTFYRLWRCIYKVHLSW